MTKLELVKEICDRNGQEQKVVLNTIETFMEVMKDSMAEGNEVFLRGFGSFILKHRAQKTARNIKRQQTVIVPAHDIPYFKACPEFLARFKKD